MLSRAILPIFLTFWPGLALAQWLGPPNTVLCNQIVNFSGGASTVQLLAPTTGKQIYVCGWSVTNSSNTQTYQVQLFFGTGATCGTGTINITPSMSINANAYNDHSQYAITSGAVGAGLCVTPSNAALSGNVYYTLVPTLGN